MTKLESANSVIDEIRKRTDEIAIALSLGKDSLVTLDLCYGKFKRIVCFYMYFVPGLEHMERWIRWTRSRYPGIELVQIPHWNLSYLLRSGLYCAPQPKVKLINLADVCKAVRENYGVQYVFLGMKKADGMNRNLMLKGYAHSNYINNDMVYPLAEWNQREILTYMKSRGLPEPVRYSLKASSGLGFGEDCFLWLREHFPQDLLKIYQAFPMSRRILFEHDYRQKNKE